jgi:hypothetical protein
MLGLLATVRLLLKATLPRRMGRVVAGWADTVDVLVKKERLGHIEREQYLDINRDRRRWEGERYGAVEVFLEFHIAPEDLPHTEAFHWAIGDFVFKTSEWVDLWNWLDVKTWNATNEEKMNIGVDGHWLLEVGRRRWADESVRNEARKNANLSAEKMVQ